MSAAKRNKRLKRSRNDSKQRVASPDRVAPQSVAGRRRTLAIGSMIALAIAVAAWLMFRSRPDRPAVLDAAAAGYNVLLITMDTTRADCLGCYGHPIVKTPNIDRLAREGVLFSQCMATCPLTLPSHASIMTGTYPFVHRARNNGRYLVDEGNVTIAERLARRGYATAGQVSAYVLDAIWGIDQGFAEFRSESIDSGDRQRIERMESLQSETADQVVDRALTWLDSATPDPFFLWTHFFDPHEPLDPPPRFMAAYDDPYFGEIAFTDEQIGRLLNELRRRGLLERTLVILTGDHGESRRDHKELTHSYYVYDATMRVPLIVWRPRLISPGRRIDAQVSTVDIAPTILAMLGADEPAGIQGVSLAPLIDGRTGDLNIAAYGETLSPRHAFGYAALRTIRADGWKYIHAPTPELYDLRRDPGEMRNIAAEHPDRVAKMREQLATLITESSTIVADAERAAQLDAEATRKLAALGYVGGYTPPDIVDEREDISAFDGPDPKSRIDAYTQFTIARSFDAQDEYEKARQVLIPLVKSEPNAPAYRELLAKQLRKLDLTAAAIEQYEKLVELQPRHATAHFYLGRLYGDLNQWSDSARHLRVAAESMPQDVDTWTSLGLAMREMGEYDEAETAFRRVIELDANNNGARGELAALLQRRGLWSESKALLTEAVDANPRNVEAVNNLAWLLATAPMGELRDGELAIDLAEQVRAALPEENPAILDTVAAAYAEIGRFGDATQTLEDAIALVGDADEKLASELRERLELYKAGHAYRQPDQRLPAD